MLILTYLGEDNDSLGLGHLPPETLERLGYALFNPIVLIYAVTKTVPDFKIYVASAIVILWSVLIGAALTYGATTGAYEGLAWLEFIAVGVLGISGALIGAYTVKEKYYPDLNLSIR